MVTPAVEQEAVVHLKSAHRMTEGRACKVTGAVRMRCLTLPKTQLQIILISDCHKAQNRFWNGAAYARISRSIACRRRHDDRDVSGGCCASRTRCGRGAGQLWR